MPLYTKEDEDELVFEAIGGWGEGAGAAPLSSSMSCLLVCPRIAVSDHRWCFAKKSEAEEKEEEEEEEEEEAP